MTRDDITRMAREAATEDGSTGRADGKTTVLYAAKTNQFLERFADLVAKAERKACAELVSSYLTSMSIDVGVALALRKNK